ncbi:MAG: thermonuclease family protein, partial [Candidatus Absconditabacteria bacterium]
NNIKMKKIFISILFLVIFSTTLGYNLNNNDYSNINKFGNIILEKTKGNNTILKKLKIILIDYLKVNAVNTKKSAYYKELVKLVEIYIHFSEDKTLEGPFEVTKVVDGDTINIKYNNENVSIRLIGIDAPESSTTRYGYLQCWGKESTVQLKSLLENKNIYIEFDETQGNRDKYGRLLAYIRLDGININYYQIEKGNSSEYTYKKDYKYKEGFLIAEFYAKRLKNGMRGESCKGINKIIETDTKNVIGISSENCGSKKYCSEMISCEEAYTYLNNCNLKRLDADGDGIPCESICK